MNKEHMVIVTAQPEFSQAVLVEIERLDKQFMRIEEIIPGLTLGSAPDVPVLMQKAAKERPVFVRHLAPVQTVIPLHNDEQDIGAMAMAIAALPSFTMLERGVRFAVQSRFAQTDKNADKRPYSSGKLNQALAEAFTEETGAIESIKKPQIIISILCTSQKSYLGISSAEANLSSWPGGARHYAQTPEQISRAEFKLLEALETFDVELPAQGHVLDLGAAPGGWTRLLLDAGLQVVAVDPAHLDPRLAKHKRLQHYYGYAEGYLEEALHKHSRFDIIVNDMRMDAREAARLLVKASRCLRPDGFIISTLKLPHTTGAINPLATLKEAISILSKRYGVVQAHQLFHNRQEVTVFAARPFSLRDNHTH